MAETLHATPKTLLPSAGKPKLLIVDDDEGLCTQLKWAFAQDFKVILVGDQRSALEVFSRERPLIVTLDLGLPPRPNSVDEGCLKSLQFLIGQIQPNRRNLTE